MIEPGRSVSVAEAKAHLSELQDAVEKGEHVQITMEWFDEPTKGLPATSGDSADVVRQMRDERH